MVLVRFAWLRRLVSRSSAISYTPQAGGGQVSRARYSTSSVFCQRRSVVEIVSRIRPPASPDREPFEVIVGADRVVSSRVSLPSPASVA